MIAERPSLADPSFVHLTPIDSQAPARLDPDRMTLMLRPLARLIASLLLASLALPLTSTASTPPEPRQVELGVYILDILEIDEPAAQFAVQLLVGTYWQDPSVAFEGTQPRVWREEAALEEANAMWRPMVEFNRTTAPAEIEHSILRIHPDGRVEFERQMNVRLATDLDLRRLPFDTQRLQLELESFQYQAHEVAFMLPPANLRIADRISLPQWRPGKLTAEVAPRYLELYDETYSRATVTIEVTRRFQFYIWQMIVPLCILIGMAFAVFFLPPTDLADRMNVIIASLLTVVALSFSLHTDLPKIPYLTIIDWLFFLAYLFLGLAMAGMVWIRKLHDRDAERAERYDRWLRWAYPVSYLLPPAS